MATVVHKTERNIIQPQRDDGFGLWLALLLLGAAAVLFFAWGYNRDDNQGRATPASAPAQSAPAPQPAAPAQQ